MSERTEKLKAMHKAYGHKYEKARVYKCLKCGMEVMVPRHLEEGAKNRRCSGTYKMSGVICGGRFMRK